MTLLSARQEDEVQSDRRRRYMSTSARVATDNGFVAATTRVWTRQPFLGFRGGVTVLALNDQDSVLEYTEPKVWGVDGFRVPFANSDRTTQWFDQLDPAAIVTATKLQVVHLHEPKSNLSNILAQARNGALGVAALLFLL